MQFYPITILLSLVAAAQASVHYVQVGNAQGQTIYNPNQISARKGDHVVFQFQQKNHSATQSTFEHPCTPKKGGFDSGFHPVPPGQTDNFPTFTIPVVHDHKPIWVHCEQGANTNASHCGLGMVFAINANRRQTFAEFQAKALEIGKELGVKPPAPPASSSSEHKTTPPHKPTPPTKPSPPSKPSPPKEPWDY